MKTILIILGLLMSGCSLTANLATDNPCSAGQYQNCEECNTWKTNYPREYARYIQRVEGKTTYCP